MKALKCPKLLHKIRKKKKTLKRAKESQINEKNNKDKRINEWNTNKNRDKSMKWKPGSLKTPVSNTSSHTAEERNSEGIISQ